KGSRDPRVDIYCLAASLYYGVTGQNPTNSLARKLDNEVLISPQEIIVTISDELNEAILTGMALEAKDRPKLMKTWLQMLNYNLPIYNVKQNIVNVKQNIVNVEKNIVNVEQNIINVEEK
ncbi:MAG: serine/threonine protein kinase, partial [Dolichospermum sp.]